MQVSRYRKHFCSDVLFCFERYVIAICENNNNVILGSDRRFGLKISRNICDKKRRCG